jgi:hypothetical protein
MNTETVDAALRPLTDALGCDGYAVDVALAGNAVLVHVTAGPDACADCLVPKALMTELVMQALGDAGLGVAPEQVSLTYPNEQG